MTNRDRWRNALDLVLYLALLPLTIPAALVCLLLRDFEAALYVSETSERITKRLIP